MKKRIIATLVCLCMLVGMLPVTALAAGEIELYVGGQQIKESGCYENKSGTWTKVDGTEPANGQFSYDAATATLTLNQAKIVNYQDVTVGGGFTYPGSVIAFSQSADVSLTIVVSQGTSNITGTGGIRVVSKAGDASLSISGPGSLEVNVDKNDSGITLIGSKNVNLNIDGADVKTLAAYYYGVDLHAGDGFKAAAVVNNGKLTAGGSGGIGIYYRWTNPSDSGTSSLTVSGNAVVDTRDSKILIASEASKVQVGAGSDGNGGIVFDGKSGTVYGKVELQDDLTINEGETLTVRKDASLTVPDGKTLTNDGTITVESGGKLEGTTTGNGTLKIAPTITTQPQDVEVTENETAAFTVEATGSDLSYQWQQSTDNGNSWTNIASATSDTYTTGKTTMDMNGYQYRCVVKNSIDEVTSNTATLTVNASQVVPPEPPIGYPITVTPTQNGKVEVPTSIASEESLVTITVTPDTGHELSSLTVTDKEGKELEVTPKGDGKYTFYMPKGGVTITGKFQKAKLPFTDVSQEHWFYDAVWYVYQHDIMEGISDTSFAPFSSLSRGMMAQILYNLEGQPAVTGNSEFSDVAKNQWFYDAVTWASHNDVVNGYDNNVFLPDQAITREELAQMLYNYAKYKGYDVSASANLSQYPDGAKVSDWAKTALSWANGNGLITGHENNTIDPNGTANRAQTATILMRFHQTFLSK